MGDMDRLEIARCRLSWRLALPVIGRQEWKQDSEGRNRPVDSVILAAQGVGERRETRGGIPTDPRGMLSSELPG